MKFLKTYWPAILTSLFMVAVGVFLLVDPEGFTISVIRLGGLLFLVLGVYDIIRYFSADPMEGMKGTGFFSGLMMIAGGCFCFFKTGWILNAFPVLAVIYGIFQILIGFRKVQRLVDAVRLKMSGWPLIAISAAVTMVFGCWIVLNPGMAWISVWKFTGIAMIIEGVLDLVLIIMQSRMIEE